MVCPSRDSIWVTHPANSLARFAGNKTLVMTTTNGTRAILASLRGRAGLHRQLHQPAGDIR